MLSEREFIRKAIETWRTANLIDYVLTDLDRRVKRDKATKLSVFFAGLSAYLPEPINLFLKGESGSGKSYNTVQTLKYFPQEDVWFLGGLSPKALIHEHGILMNRYGEPISEEDKPVKPKKRDFQSEEEYEEALKRYKEELEEWKEELRDSYYLIDLKHKILVFLECPESETYRMLLPILSHDTERIEYRFTDKTKKGQLRTTRVIIEGFPATIFLTVDRKHIEELATRSFTATPETSKEKIEEANKLINLKASYPWQYETETEEFKIIARLIRQVKDIAENEKVDVLIPFPDLHELFPKEIVRDMRDFQHFIQFLKAITLLHIYQRPFIRLNGKRYLISTIEDAKKALEIYSEIFETTRTGTESETLRFYHEIVKTKDRWYLKELTHEYNKTHKKKLSSEAIRQKLNRLIEIGYVDVQKDEEDKRLNVYIPLVKEDEELSKIRQISKTWTILESKLEESFKKYSKEIQQVNPLYYKNFSEETWGEAELSIEELEAIVLNKKFLFPNRVTCQIFSEEKSSLKMENKPEKRQVLKTCQILDNSAFGFYQCSICKAEGKRVFFGSRHDLELHKMRVHDLRGGNQNA